MACNAVGTNFPVDETLCDELPSKKSIVHHNVRAQESKLGGMGLFAVGPIKKGEIVSWEYAEPYEGLNDDRPGNKIMTLEDMHERWPKQEDFEKFMGWFYQIGENSFVGPLRDEYLCITTLQNHSCDPNTWWYDDFTLIARRDIEAGQEVTFDYGTSESEENPAMPYCLCGSPLCRGKVTPNDYLLVDLQERYGDHFSSYLRGRIVASKAKLAKLQSSDLENRNFNENPKKEPIANLDYFEQFIDFRDHAS